MATPSADSQPIRIPLVATLAQRSSDTRLDAKLVNAFAEAQPNKSYAVQKRPGLVLDFQDNVSGGLGRGIYYWNRLGTLYYVVGNLLRSGFVTVGAVAGAVGPRYTFNETLGSPTYLYLATDGAGYYVSDAAPFVLNQIVDPNYPASTVPGSAYLDGTLYVMDQQARIWGTAGLNNPAAWSATNLIVAQSTPDRGVAIAKQLIYVVAFKRESTEFFYNAGNPTGSPLLPVSNAQIPYGCATGFTVQSIDDVLFWVGAGSVPRDRVLRLEKLRYSVVSTPAVERILETYRPANSWAFREGGHTYYVLTVNASPFSLVYDIGEDLWYIWQCDVNGLRDLPIIDSTGFTAAFRTESILQSTSNGAVFTASQNAYVDALSALGAGTQGIDVNIVTPNWDGEVKVRKVLPRLRIVADQNSGGLLGVAWSDDDYKTWSTPQKVDLQAELPNLTNLGTTRRRAFSLSHNSNTAMRLWALEPDVLLGSI